MRVFGVSANLMSLGAIDFGIVVDGSIVILEGILAHIYSKRLSGRTLTADEMCDEVEQGAAKAVKSSTFAVLIILIVFFPILILTGIEGKYFTPMAQTLVFCILGALFLSLTYVPMASVVSWRCGSEVCRSVSRLAWALSPSSVFRFLILVPFSSRGWWLHWALCLWL